MYYFLSISIRDLQDWRNSVKSDRSAQTGNGVNQGFGSGCIQFNIEMYKLPNRSEQPHLLSEFRVSPDGRLLPVIMI